MEPIKQKTDQLKTCLNEAVDLLDDIKDKLGMFQTQRYYRLKKDAEQINSGYHADPIFRTIPGNRH